MLLDLVMPGMNGWQVRNALRERERTRDIPVVILTSQALEDADREAREHDVFAVLSKQDLSRTTLGPAVQAAAQKRAREGRHPGGAAPADYNHEFHEGVENRR